MRKLFRGYYPPTADEFSALWQEGLFVFDANVLLNLYRYSPDVREEWLAFLGKHSDRLWIPYQAALEYQRLRLNVIAHQVKAYEDLEGELKSVLNKFKSCLESYKRHPFIQVKTWFERLESIINGMTKELNEQEQQHPDLRDQDEVRERITQIFNERVGAPYSHEELEKIYSEGKKRYERKTPPGFEDANKQKRKDADRDSERQYGDLVLWFQLIEKAKEVKKPIIFVTDDAKEDWWLKSEGKILGPLPELISEIFDKAGVLFYIYRPERFMEHARQYFGWEYSAKAIDEVRGIRENDEKTSVFFEEESAGPITVEQAVEIMAEQVATLLRVCQQELEEMERSGTPSQRIRSLIDRARIDILFARNLFPDQRLLLESPIFSKLINLEAKLDQLEQHYRQVLRYIACPP